jgi:threonine synthase
MQSLIDRFRDRLPVGESTPIVSLGEGATPLLRAARSSERLGVEVLLKWEAANPSGSFKDRGMTVAISKALEADAAAVICASTGNTAASAAAYAARAGLRAVVLQPAGAVSAAKTAQARALGARVLDVRGNFDEALSAARVLAERGTHVLVNSLNEHRLEGQKTAAFELVDELGAAPDVVALPYGGGGNLSAYARGFAEAGVGLPRLVGGAAADRAGTVASAVRIVEPVHATAVEDAIAASAGAIVRLSDDQILEAWRELAHGEGLLCEPSSAAGVAALEHVALEPGACVVCVITGHGLKDTETAARLSPPPTPVDPDPDAIAEASA